MPIWPSKDGIITSFASDFKIIWSGVISIKNQEEKKYYVEEGTIEFSNNNLLILTSSAKDLKNFDKKSIDDLINKVKAELKDKSTDKEKYIASYKIDTLKEINQ